MKSKWLYRALVMLCVLPLQGFAAPMEQPLAEAAQESRARALFHELRCVVCQSESVAESPAEVARDIRITVRQQIILGKSNAEIKEFLVSRYGDFILMQPPLNATTLALWIGPLLLFIVGLAFTYLFFRPKRKTPPEVR